MGLQFIKDSNGKAIGVFIPIKEWTKLKKQYKNLEVLEFKVPTKEELLHEFKQSVLGLKLMDKSKLNKLRAKDLLEELLKQIEEI